MPRAAAAAAASAAAAIAEARQLLARLEARRAELEAEVGRKQELVERLRAGTGRARFELETGNAGAGRARFEPGNAGDEDEDLADVPPAQRLVVPGDVLDLSDPDKTELEWCGTSGLKITLIAGLENLRKLETLSLRSGFVRKPSGLAHLRGTLRVIELYENRLRTLEGVQEFKLEVLDVSYNRLGAMEAPYLAPLGPTLKRLYMAENRLSEMSADALRPLVNLEVLDLGGNSLREIRGLETLAKLRELWLGKNKITKIQGLDGLRSLVRVSIQSNRVTKIENLDALADTLEELYLSDQGISVVENLGALRRLTTLDLTNNKLATTLGLPALPDLTDLWMGANGVASFEDVARLAALFPRLDTLMLDRNPIANDFQYRQRVKALVPSLTCIDSTPALAR